MDHDGDGLNNVDVEVLYKGMSVGDDEVLENNSVDMEVDYPGTYTILARFKKDIDCGFITSPIVGSHCQCQDKWCQEDCPETGEDHIFEDEKGLPYTCRYSGIIDDQQAYVKIYHFTSFGIIRTHVKPGDRGDKDIARVTIETRANKLFKHANESGYVIRSSTGIGDTMLWHAPAETIATFTDLYVVSKLIGDSMKYDPASMFVFNVAGSAVNPEEGIDEYFNDLFTWDGLGESAGHLGLSTAIKLYAEAKKFSTGKLAVLLIVGNVLLKESYYEPQKERKRCSFTETDDLDIVLSKVTPQSVTGKTEKDLGENV